MQRKYEPPSFLVGQISQAAYERWVRRKAQAHVKRDRLRGNQNAIAESYRNAIHLAVINSQGLDAYTGEKLDWSLISTYDNQKSSIQRRAYKHKLAMLPTVDHVGDGSGDADFRICGWRTNGAKHDLNLTEFLALCKTVLEHHGYVIKKSN